MSITLSATSTAAALRIRRRKGEDAKKVSREDGLYWLILIVGAPLMLLSCQHALKWAKANENMQAKEIFYYRSYHKSTTFTPKIIQNPVPSMLAPKERLPEALIWARQHPDDKLAVVARLFKVNYKTLHLRTKPISYKHIGAHDLGYIERWFADYKSGLARYKITTENLYNMDETNIRLACLVGQEVVVPVEIAEVYEEIPENRRSITVMETIYTNSTTIHPIVIISSKQHMELWWELRQPDEGEELYTLSELGFTNDQLTMKWFKHFLAQIGREVQLEDTAALPWKMVLLDNHRSYLQEELILLVSRHKIIIWTYISHATHLIQPCDIKYFNQWKHW
ncbi:transposase protein [Rutstroemia sp. NJR-2017a BBW]|nr:transposase protein [Rutstroemia sp. NJR-2017a BBW]